MTIYLARRGQLSQKIDVLGAGFGRTFVSSRHRPDSDWIQTKYRNIHINIVDVILESDWDLAKETINRRKYGCSFLEATETCKDPMGLQVVDRMHSENEQRSYWIGRSYRSAARRIHLAFPTKRCLTACYGIRWRYSQRITRASKNSNAKF